VASPSLCLCHGHFEHIFDVFMFHCVKSVKLLLRIFEFGALPFDCFVYRQSVTCLKRFTRYGHYAGEMEDTIIQKLEVVF